MRPTGLRDGLISLLPSGPAVGRLYYSVLGLFAVVGLGVAGYVWIADFSSFDALYQTVLTVTTIGFQEVNPMTQDGRIFTIVLSILGVGAVLFVFGSAAALIFEGDIKRDLGAWRMTKRIDALQDHVIVCGAGRVGREVARELWARRSPFVLIDPEAEKLAASESAEWLTIQGDASSNEILQQAGIDRAHGVIVATQSDALNTFIILTAKGINSGVYVTSRLADPESESTLFQAGADRVISPTTIAGRRMAVATLHPSVVDFAETVLRGGQDKPVFAQIDIARDAPWDGMSIEEAFEGRSVRVLGTRSAAGALDVAPEGSILLAAGDALMVYGHSEEIEELAVFAAAPV